MNQSLLWLEKKATVVGHMRRTKWGGMIWVREHPNPRAASTSNDGYKVEYSPSGYIATTPEGKYIDTLGRESKEPVPMAGSKQAKAAADLHFQSKYIFQDVKPTDRPEDILQHLKNYHLSHSFSPYDDLGNGNYGFYLRRGQSPKLSYLPILNNAGWEQTAGGAKRGDRYFSARRKK